MSVVLKQIRRERGITRDQLAYALDVSTRTISRWEKGESKVDPVQLARLRSICQLEADEEILSTDLVNIERTIYTRETSNLTEGDRNRVDQVQLYHRNAKVFQRSAINRMDPDAFCDLVVPEIVCERFDFKCAMCGLSLDPEDYELDHIVPLMMHGEHTYRNVRPLHPTCHMIKTRDDYRDRSWWSKQVDLYVTGAVNRKQMRDDILAPAMELYAPQHKTWMMQRFTEIQ